MSLIVLIIIVIVLLILAWLGIDALAGSLGGDGRLYGLLKFLAVALAIYVIANKAGLF